ncbi:hypothetical protein LINPERPRIM_LOCUS28729 [Linum perenne]
MLLHKTKKSQVGGNRLLISVTVLGSAGPIRFVVREEALVAAVIDTALKSYAREGRLPVLGSDLKDFFLYCPSSGSGALSPWESIGSAGCRNFMLCKKTAEMKKREEGVRSSGLVGHKRRGSWKTWINKSFSRKISSH